MIRQKNNIRKSADGLLALQWYKEGKIDKIIEYCIKDVEITRDVFLYGQKNKCLFLKSKYKGRQKLEVDWDIDALIKSCKS